MCSRKLFIILVIMLLETLMLAGQDRTVKICAHRGYWKNEMTRKSENSIASLKCAQKERFWGSEIDVHLTTDNVIVVNHDRTIDGITIRENPYSAIKGHKLPNGEERPTLDKILRQLSKSRHTILVLEVCGGGLDDRMILLSDLCIQKLMDHHLFDPSRVMFISGNFAVCNHLVRAAPGFQVQFVSRGEDPESLKESGITGIDYDYRAFQAHPEWVARAHELGMDVNAWVVNQEEVMREMIRLGVDCITTDEPILVRHILKDAEEHHE